MKRFKPIPTNTKGGVLLMFIWLCINQNIFAQKKPNILVIMGDDIGWYNPSCYNRGIQFPPRQKPASFNLDEVMRKLSEPTN